MKHPSASASARERTWRKVMRQWERSGLTQAEFCRVESLSLSAFRWWRSELRRRDRQRPHERSVKENRNGKRKRSPQGESISFVPVEVIPATAEKTQGGFMEVVLRGDRRIVVGAEFDPAAVERLVAILERMPC